MPMARSGHEVGRAVRSVLAQEFEDVEILIGDETGAAEETIAGLADPRLHYRRNPTRLGFSGNHMALLDRARGRYLTVLHDDDRWAPDYLARLVPLLERHGDVGLVCCRAVLDRGSGDSGDRWPMPLVPGRNESVLEVLLAEEWFMLLDNSVWRREVWAGPARRWPDLCCGDLQFFLSAAEARWPFYFLDAALSVYSVHEGQSGAWRGADNGLGVADDVLAFWEQWLEGRPPGQIALTARQRARWHLRRARALLLARRTVEARQAVNRAQAFGVSDLPELRRLKLALVLPNPVVRRAVALKRGATDVVSSVHRLGRGGADGAGSVNEGPL
jgi:glycosyltransferase involved in cell wall biosynthesis